MASRTLPLDPDMCDSGTLMSDEWRHRDERDIDPVRSVSRSPDKGLSAKSDPPGLESLTALASLSSRPEGTVSRQPYRGELMSETSESKSFMLVPSTSWKECSVSCTDVMSPAATQLGPSAYFFNCSHGFRKESAVVGRHQGLSIPSIDFFTCPREPVTSRCNLFSASGETWAAPKESFRSSPALWREQQKEIVIGMTIQNSLSGRSGSDAIDLKTHPLTSQIHTFVSR